jgi:hypothetical protein
MQHDNSLWAKRLIVSALTLILILPALQAKWHLVPVGALDGYNPSTDAEKPTLLAGDLLAGNYQPRLEAYLDDRLGFRAWLIRLRNQVDFSLFSQLHTGDVVVGQRGVLYQGGPTEAYIGRDYLGAEAIAAHAQRVREVQDTLARHGTQLLYVLAPGKPGYLPEDLPADVQAIGRGPTNYEGFAQALPRAGVHVLDAAALFRRWKPTAAHPLFPRGGTHWSGYSITLVADTLARAVEALTRTDLPNFTTRPGEVTTRALRGTDEDIAKGLNLLIAPRPYPMAYPNVTFAPPTARQRRPNTLLVGDSFTQSLYIFYPYLPKLLGDNSRFWYYNERVLWPDDTGGESHYVRELKLRQQLAGRDLLLILATEQNLSKRSFGLVDQLYELYHTSAPSN